MIKFEAHSRPDKHDGSVMNLTIGASGSVYDLECELRALLLQFYKQIYINEGKRTMACLVTATLSAIARLREEIDGSI